MRNGAVKADGGTRLYITSASPAGFMIPLSRLPKNSSLSAAQDSYIHITQRRISEAFDVVETGHSDPREWGDLGPAKMAHILPSSTTSPSPAFLKTSFIFMITVQRWTFLRSLSYSAQSGQHVHELFEVNLFKLRQQLS